VIVVSWLVVTYPGGFLSYYVREKQDVLLSLAASRTSM
jgi:hypothetical protein